MPTGSVQWNKKSVRVPSLGMVAKWVAPDMPDCELTGWLIDCTTILTKHLKEIVLDQTSERHRLNSPLLIWDEHPVCHALFEAGSLGHSRLAPIAG